MKSEVMQRLGAMLNALNSITVSGKFNLANLSGSIALTEELITLLNDAEITAGSNKE